MKKIYCLIYILFTLPLLSQEKEGITHSGQLTGNPPFPIENYSELDNPKSTSETLWNKKNRTFVSWANTDVRYNKEIPAPIALSQETLHLSAWKGEQLNAQLIISAHRKSLELNFEISDLSSSQSKIESKNITGGFVRYVMTDELNKDGKGACGPRNHKEFDSTLVADPIDHLNDRLSIAKNTTRPVWVTINVPRDITKGKYTGEIKIRDGDRILKKLGLEIEVLDRVLPKSENWKFHLDLWQNPYAAARYYRTDLWSDEHFAAMKQDLQHYVNAGGKSITASIMNRPWNGQTYDPFQSMVTWRKTIDNKWSFDFTVFDKWVEFMMDLGVKKQINCYSMVPWRLAFEYFDEASNSMKTIETKPGEKAYSEMWGAMLKAFATHLKKKGWFGKTYISMDERPMDVMLETIKLIKSADKNFKISFAGSFHKELLERIDDYCLALGENYPQEILGKRQNRGKISTFYTSCAHPRPNSFTFSPPAETAWYGWYAAATGLDGYLRWAYASWPLEPLLDSRFSTWAAGDTYLVYPGGRTSIRFQKLLEGIQAYEKIKLLRREFIESGEKEDLKKLDTLLNGFASSEIIEKDVAQSIKKANIQLNSF
ncbi:DUF4091 domain-containing protein [Gramella jeungdoensis]|uniref:DUF4091 domain-containing protein n=1 Tax=Gramella jeungdoensis TaxID=708091 RepID=A0ABT0Z552_9FLAO|nr:glycoside hydrolase domain-containing protein [Gramella jeungdoensis]MCM8570360.1 DUF4091 domain-containing protein [Gramella jeungdoensis]